MKLHSSSIRHELKYLLIISTIFSSHFHWNILYDWCLLVHITIICRWATVGQRWLITHISRGRKGQSNSWVNARVMGQHMGLGSPYYNRKVGHATLVYYVWGMGMYGLCFRLGPHKNGITLDLHLDPTRNLTCRFLLFILTLGGFVFLPRSLSLFLHAFCVFLWPRCTSYSLLAPVIVLLWSWLYGTYTHW